MFRVRSFWVYSAGLAVAWAIVLAVTLAARPASMSQVLLVLGGFVIAWVSTTVARYVYPPPKRWSGPSAAGGTGR